jgi:phosphoribosyl 1,2-cyclic phosphodiesterase
MTSPIRNLRITFWGTQGSVQHFPGPDAIQRFSDQIAVGMVQRVLEDITARTSAGDGQGVTAEELLGGPPSPATIQAYYQRLGRDRPDVYGGETTCTEIETSDGYVIVIDGGSGIRQFAKHRVRAWAGRADRTLYIFGTHDHLDHRIGLPFSDICFVKPDSYHLNVYGNSRFLSALDDRFGVFSKTITKWTYLDDPLDYRMIPATFSAVEFRNFQNADPQAKEEPPWEVRDINQPVRIGRTTITPFEIYHSATPCLAYKFEHGGVTFVFCTDHELRHGDDPADPRQIASDEAERRIRSHCQGIEAAYFDGQYLLDEYYGRRGAGSSSLLAVPRIDWGHTCIEDVVERSKACAIQRTFIGHHDPDREWMDRVHIDEQLRRECAGTGIQIELAKDRYTFDL